MRPSLTIALVAACASCGMAAWAQTATSPTKPAPPRPAAGRASPRPAAGTFESLSKQADVARDAKQLDKAITLYKQALALKPDWIEGWWSLGTACYDLDRYAEANDAFRRVLARDDSMALAWVFKGLCSYKLKNYDEALRELMRAPRNALPSRDISEAVRYHLAILLTRIEQYEASLGVLADFGVEGNDTPRIIEAMGLATLRMPLLPEDLPGSKREMVLLAGRAQYFQAARLLQPAENAYRTLVTRYPDSPNVHYAFGVMLAAEQPDAAIEQFTQELKVSPTHTLAKVQLAFTHIKRGEFAEAKPWAEQAVQAAPTEFIAQNALGQALLGNGDVEGAVRALENAVKLAPDSPAMHFALARAYRAANRPADADREQAEFTRLDRLVRQQRTGVNSVGGVAPAPPR